MRLMIFPLGRLGMEGKGGGKKMGSALWAGVGDARAKSALDTQPSASDWFLILDKKFYPLDVP